MKLSRREFLKLTGTAASSVMLPLAPAMERLAGEFPLHKRVGETPTICSFCGVGCGAIVASNLEGRILNVEGDPDHPINRGRLCSKGSSLSQLAMVDGRINPRRLTEVLYRAPGGQRWEEKTWEWAIETIAKRIRATRDTHWMAEDKHGNLVNRTEAVGALGSAFLNTQEAYLLTKLVRALGVVYNENESRICVTSAVAAGAESVGRGPMTNHWIDLRNSDCVMIIGSNAAETFPLSFKWITEAMEKGAKLISVDPRFTRTSARADIYVPIRTGTDIAFVGGMINYTLENGLYHQAYVTQYTDAPFLVDPDFDFEDGLFAGYDPAIGEYDRSTWQYQTDDMGLPKRDMTLEDPNCVFQRLKTHFRRYDPDTVCQITGTSKEVFLAACKAFTATGVRDRAGAIVCSSAASQHTHGTQNVRSYYILQLLLGNIGVAGGGVNGIAGASNGLGCTLQGRLFHVLPGDVPMPASGDASLEQYLSRVTPSPSGMENTISPWTSRPNHVISLLKAWYGDAASEENGFGWNLLPKIGGNYSFIDLFDAMRAGTVKGLLCWAMNPAVSGPESGVIREALRNLDWAVVVDLVETETATFWKEPGEAPLENDTEVFLLPAATSIEKEGSLMNSARWMQWRYKAAEPPGQARSDLWILDQLTRKLQELYTAEGGANAEAITQLKWDYGTPPDVHRVAQEMNGYDLTTRRLLASPEELQEDGTTSCGNWLWCGSYTDEENMMARRDDRDRSGIGLYSDWAWCMPFNRRIMYNRASVDLDGKPWNPETPVISWDPASQRWIGDVPDGDPPPGEAYPFIMQRYGRARLFGAGMADGPFPEHYEPWESPVSNLLSPVQASPLLKAWADKKGARSEYPILATTHRLVEHMHTGALTRNLPWLDELMPQMFVEISEELAAERGLTGGDPVIIRSARGEIEAVALVTKRLRPFRVNGQLVHEVAMPWHWGYAGLSPGDSANSLTSRVADGNAMIPEYRAFLVDIVSKGAA